MPGTNDEVSLGFQVLQNIEEEQGLVPFREIGTQLQCIVASDSAPPRYVLLECMHVEVEAIYGFSNVIFYLSLKNPVATTDLCEASSRKLSCFRIAREGKRVVPALLVRSWRRRYNRQPVEEQQHDDLKPHIQFAGR